METEAGGTLFLSIPYDEGWSITVDGEKKTAKKLFDAFMGIELSPGSHVIEMHYMPQGLKMGAAISLGSLAVLAAAFGISHARKQRERKQMYDRKRRERARSQKSGQRQEKESQLSALQREGQTNTEKHSQEGAEAQEQG